jgi:roadblock/LC7 domain-containing protein
MNPDQKFLDNLLSLSGVLAAGLTKPDRSVLQACPKTAQNKLFADNNLPWKALGDTFKVLHLHRVEARRLEWTFTRGLFCGFLAANGDVLGVLVQPGETHLASVIEGCFHSLTNPGLKP